MKEDQSPQLHPATLRKELVTTAQMNLTGLSFSLFLQSDELPEVLAALQNERNATLKARGLFMAIAFEAGRRIGIKQAMGMADISAKRRILELLDTTETPSN